MASLVNALHLLSMDDESEAEVMTVRVGPISGSRQR